MDMPIWAGFVLASAVLLAIPGPTVAVVVSCALQGGRRTATPLATGVLLGHFTAMTLSMMGLGAVLAASGLLFAGLKLAGAAYLIWLGARLWLGPRLEAQVRVPGAGTFGPLGRTWIVTALNPLSIMFFVAFVPQFLDPAGQILRQMLIFEATFLALAFGNALAYGLLAASIPQGAGSARLIGSSRWAAGAILVATGSWTAVSAF